MDDFWSDSDYFTGPWLSDAMVRNAEALLGYRLPESYIKLLKSRNGGSPLRDCFPTTTRTSWAEDHICITGIRGIGGEWGIDSPILGTKAMIQEWGYPPIGVIVGECPSAGHDVVMLDYSQCGKDGEPRVVHVDMEMPNTQIMALAEDFQSFIDGLVDGGRYEEF